MSADGAESPKVLELRALRAKRAELVRQREESEANIDQTLEDETRALRDEEAINKAVEEYGALGRKIEVVETDLGIVIVKRCPAMRWKKFTDADKWDNEAFRGLVTPLVVYPDSSGFDEMLDEQPATLQRVAQAVARMAGVRMQEVAKK